MPGLVIHDRALITCLHQAPVTAIPPSPPRVFVNQTMAVLGVGPAPSATVAGCPFFVGTKPSPCIRILLTPATRVFMNNGTQPVAILTPLVLGVNELSVPQGPPNSMGIQLRVIAT
jgi:hypothetical protein